MNIHSNARLTPLGRARLVRLIAEGVSFSRAAALCGCSPKTAAKWWKRFLHEGRNGLSDRRSRPHSLRNPTPDSIVQQIITLRRERLTGAHIAAKTGVSPATVSRILRRAGISRLRDLDPAEPVRRYERDHPGDLIHLDIKRLGKFHSGASKRKGHQCCCPSQGSSRVVCLNGGERRAGHDRQWVVLQISCLQGSLHRARAEAHPHQTLYTQNQRQSRTVHPDRPARMGLRPRISNQSPG